MFAGCAGDGSAGWQNAAVCMSGNEYVVNWVTPQFYFHLVTAYNILRHNGVPLGKADYVQHMLAYLRQ
ncbi:DUF1993 family protein [Pseudomonas sp. 09C 129]|uniref:DUF1993 family protein n=1 Tax=Pseudomonas sp. 09C 129 TaxID=2054915 RepID=UPI003530D3B7